MHPSLAQTDQFIVGDDEIHVLSSGLNKKDVRTSFTTNENIYVKLFLVNLSESLVTKKENEHWCFRLEFPTTKTVQLIYPHFQDDLSKRESISFAFRSNKIMDSEIVDLRKEFEACCTQASFKKGPMILKFIHVTEEGKTIDILSARTLTFK